MKDAEFLKQITDIPGGSGDEGGVRKFLKEEIAKVTTPIVDKAGNVYGSIGKGPKILAVGHMDEIGFMVRSIDNNGGIRLSNVGFVFPWGITCQIFQIVTSKGIVEGVIGMNPNQGHGNPFEKYPDLESLFLDVGCKTKEEALALGIEVGNAVIAKSRFTVLQNKQMNAKAWDNRVGCAISIRAMQELASKDLNVTYIGGGTVQEEVGCRGARALALNIQPDISFSLDTGPAADEDGARIGEGIQLLVMDSATIANKKLLEFAKSVCKKYNIKYQLYLMRRGGSDTSEFQNMTGGCPSLALAVPVKYIHSPTSICSYDDYQAGLDLMIHMVEEMNEQVVADIQNYD